MLNDLSGPPETWPKVEDLSPEECAVKFEQLAARIRADKTSLSDDEIRYGIELNHRLRAAPSTAKPKDRPTLDVAQSAAQFD